MQGCVTIKVPPFRTSGTPRFMLKKYPQAITLHQQRIEDGVDVVGG